MSMSMVIALIILVAAIVAGCVLNINMGLLGVIGAYIVGCFVLEMKANAVIALWPISLMFNMIFILLFFNIAKVNGTLVLFAKKVVYRVRRIPWAIPIALFAIVMIVAMLGVGTSVSYFMVVPIWFIAMEAGMDPIFTALVFATGANAGAWVKSGNDGIIALGLLESNVSSELASQISGVLTQNYFIVSITVFIIGYLVFKGWKCKAVVEEKPEPFNLEQRKTGILIICMMLVYVIPTMISTFFNVPAIKWFASHLSLSMLAAVFCFIAILMKICDFRKVLSEVPWGTSIMCCGMGLLCAVVVQTGLVDYISGILTNNVSNGMIPILLGLCSGILSLFTALIGVVMPTLYPLALSISEATSMSPALLISVVSICGGVMGISPFSFVGAMNYSACPEQHRKRLFYGLFGIAAVSLAVSLIYTALGVFG